MKTTPVYILLLFSALSTLAVGDVIVTRDGRRVTGVILAESDTRVDLLTSGGKTPFPRSAIERLERESPPMNQLRHAGFSLRRQRPTQAADQVDQAIGAGIPLARARAWLSEESASLELALDKTDTAAMYAWAEQTENLIADWPRHDIGPTTATAIESPTTATLAAYPLLFDNALATATPTTRPVLSATDHEFILLMANIFAATSRNPLAVRLLCSLPPEAIASGAETRPAIQTALTRHYTLCLNTRDYTSAARALHRIEAARLPIAPSCRVMSILAHATLASSLDQHDHALQILHDQLHPTNPALARLRSGEIWTQARQRLTRQEKYDQALALLAKWRHSIPAAAQAESAQDEATLWRRLAEKRLAENHPAQARQAYEAYIDLVPTADRTPLRVCAFQERLNALDPTDYAAAFRLGQWAHAQARPELAIIAFRRAAAHEPLRPPAQEQIALLEEEAALARLDRWLKMRQQGDSDRVLKEIDQSHNIPELRAVQGEIDRLRAICESDQDKSKKIRTSAAQTLLDQARLLYQKNANIEALAQLRTLDRLYGDTPEGRQGRAMMQAVRSRLLDGETSREKD